MLGNRSWRVRGLDRVTSFEALKVNVLVARTDTPPGTAASGFHVDTLDLYSARARGVFVGQAAGELKVPPEVVKSDLGRVLLACEAKAGEVITAAAASGLVGVDVKERVIETVKTVTVVQHHRVDPLPPARPRTVSEVVDILAELSARVDSGRVYDRDLPALTAAVGGLVDALNRRDKTSTRPRW